MRAKVRRASADLGAYKDDLDKSRAREKELLGRIAELEEELSKADSAAKMKFEEAQRAVAELSERLRDLETALTDLDKRYAEAKSAEALATMDKDSAKARTKELKDSVFAAHKALKTELWKQCVAYNASLPAESRKTEAGLRAEYEKFGTVEQQLDLVRVFFARANKHQPEKARRKEAELKRKAAELERDDAFEQLKRFKEDTAATILVPPGAASKRITTVEEALEAAEKGQQFLMDGFDALAAPPPRPPRDY